MNEVLAMLIKDSGILWEGFLQTLYMVSFTMIFTAILGIPLGIGVVVTEEGNILENKTVHFILSAIINITRSIPFILLMIAVIPLSKLIVGSFIGPTASIVPLCIGAVPFLGRIVERSLKEVDKGVVEAAESMGATPFQIIKVLLSEALPSLVLGLTITTISLIGYSAIVGTVGGGGLGDIAIRYGFHRYQTEMMMKSVIILIIIVQIVQFSGNYFAKRLDRS